MVFQPGQSGNPSGARKDTLGLQELARRQTATVIRIFTQILKSQKAPAAARVSAGLALLDRAYGRPPSFSTTDVGDFRKAVELSDDDLLRIAAAAGIKLEPAPVSHETEQPVHAVNTLPSALPRTSSSSSSH